MILTFGKFRGWDICDLAKAGEIGQNYLSWCVNNLKSPKWRNECDRALEINDFDFDLAVKAVIQSDNLTHEEAVAWVNSEQESLQEQLTWETKEEQAESLLRLELVKCGLLVTQVAQLLGKYKWDFFGAVEFGAIKFSSEEKRRKITAAFDKFYNSI